MEEVGSVTILLRESKKGDGKLIEKIWDLYYPRLVGLAKEKLNSLSPAKADPEQVALSALKTFWRRAELGEYPEVNDSDALWKLLFTITKNKAINFVRQETAQKRNPIQHPEDRVVVTKVPVNEELALENATSKELDPGVEAEIADQLRLLMDRLPDEQIREIAGLKLEGLKNPEIARRLGCSLSTVERRSDLIKAIWKKEIQE